MRHAHLTSFHRAPEKRLVTTIAGVGGVGVGGGGGSRGGGMRGGEVGGEGVAGVGVGGRQQQQEHSELSGKALGWYAEGPRFSSASVLPCGGLLASKDIISNHVHNY